MRLATARNCREALDSMLGSDHPTAWQIREACLDTWPSSVIKSLGVLVNGARGAELLRQALASFPTNISLLKQATAVAITAGASAQAGTTGSSAGASGSSEAGKSTATGAYHKGMAVFTVAKGGLMYEASIGGQKFSYKPKE